MSKVRIPIMAVLAIGASLAPAEQFWYTYEGNDYPEAEGPWIRYTRGGGAERSLVEGNLILDSLPDWHIVDEYYIDNAFVLQPGESLLVDWRVRIDQVLGQVDPGVFVTAGPHGTVQFEYAVDGIWSGFEWVWIDFAPGVSHEYSFRSADLETYTLYIDGQLAHTGYFVGPMSVSRIGWGDCIEGGSSVSTWDWFRFGVVPEPSTGVLLALAGVPAIAITARRARRKAHATKML